MPQLQINDKISLFYEEYGTGALDADNIILSAQVGFYPKGMQQYLATLGWHLMLRTAKCLPHGKLILYSNCGHDIDTDLIEETCDEADRFLRNAIKTKKWYLPVEEK